MRRPARGGLLLGLALLLAAPGPGLAAEPLAAAGLSPPGRLREAPDFSLPAASGPAVRLAARRGHVVLLAFWAAWCPPRRQEMPTIERLHVRYRDRGLDVVAVSVDAGGADAVRPFVREHGLSFPTGLDASMTVAGRYGVTALPSTFLLDRRGRVHAMAVGPREWDAPAVHAVIEALLARAADPVSRPAAGHR